MQGVTTVGLDIAKSVFQVHGVDAVGQVVIRRQLKRRYVFAFFQKLPPCLVGIEACASSHHWSRERPRVPHLKAEHMAAPTKAAKREESSCQLGAVHTWHKGDIREPTINFRFRSKADMPASDFDVRSRKRS